MRGKIRYNRVRIYFSPGQGAERGVYQVRLSEYTHCCNDAVLYLLLLTYLLTIYWEGRRIDMDEIMFVYYTALSILACLSIIQAIRSLMKDLHDDIRSSRWNKRNKRK